MPSPLASIYSTADSFKRSLLDMLSNPVEAAQQIVGNANDRAGILNQLTAEAAQEGRNGGPLFGPKSQQLAGTLADAYNPAGMIVYHGSPYKFDAFSPAKIGSGEGTAAYGHGFYVAELPETAKSYQAMAQNPSGRRGSNQGDASLDSLIMLNAKQFTDGDTRQLSEFIKQHPKAFANPEKMVQRIEQYVENKPPSFFYKIDLPDDQVEKMLDWNAELGKQSKEVQDLAKQYGLNMDDLGGDLVAAMDAKRPAGAEAMRQAGISGIKHFDAQTRGGKKANARNFVVFPQNEGLLNILERNGVPLK